jgi:hypothetical protein
MFISNEIMESTQYICQINRYFFLYSQMPVLVDITKATLCTLIKYPSMNVSSL